MAKKMTLPPGPFLDTVLQMARDERLCVQIDYSSWAKSIAINVRTDDGLRAAVSKVRAINRRSNDFSTVLQRVGETLMTRHSATAPVSWDAEQLAVQLQQLFEAKNLQHPRLTANFVQRGILPPFEVRCRVTGTPHKQLEANGYDANEVVAEVLAQGS
jgi:hypothetical protein